MTNTEPTIHVLMRYSDKLHHVDDTIEEHLAVIRQYGSVWLGKLGKPLGFPKIDRINKQCRQNIPSFLYLVQRAGHGGSARVSAYRGSVLEMSRELPETERYLVP